MSKNYRFGIVSYDVISDPGISLQAKGIYAILCIHADKNRTCYPSINTIADLADVHPRTVKRKIVELKQAGYLLRKNRKLVLA